MSDAADLVLVSRRVATPDGIRPAAVRVAGGRILSVDDPGATPSAPVVVDAGDAVVFPGLVDTHVHVNEPGRTDWEGFATATRAAAAGGVTTLLDMPLNSVPATTTVAALEEKRRCAEGRCAVDVGFIGGVVPGNAAQVPPLIDAGVLAFKCFLVDSGVPEFPPIGEPELRAVLPALARLRTPLMAHAEVPGPIARAAAAPAGPPREYASWLAARPVAAETEAVALLCRLAAELRTRVHVVHVSAADTVTLLRAARGLGAPVTAETCPHYLVFEAGRIPDGATEFKCAPPIRGAEHRDALWAGLDDGTLDLVVSDHSPAPPALKALQDGDFFAAWGGISSLQLGLPAVWTEARARGVPLARLAEWMSAAPARLAGLDGRKGRIAPGCDADFVVWRPEDEFVVRPDDLRHRHRLTPWLGRRLAGVVEATYLRGHAVYRRGAPDRPPAGLLLQRASA